MIQKIPIAFLFSILLVVLGTTKLIAQEECIVKLNEAEKLYEEGKIEKIPELLNNCIENGFNKENKTQALRLLTLVYLFEDNQVKADKEMLKLLKFNPEFKVNQAIDPVEFTRLYDSYITAPIFSIGITGGVNFSSPQLIETIGLYEFSKTNPRYYNAGVGINAGIKAAYHVNKIIDVSLEPGIGYYSFTVKENVSDIKVSQMNESLITMDFPVYGSYVFYKMNQFQFWGEAGFIYSMYLSGNMSGTLTYTNNLFPDYEGTSFSTASLRKKSILTSSLGVGTKIKLNRSNLQIGIRYKFGLNNIVENKDFYDYYPSDYEFHDNMFTNNSLSINVSYNYEFYIHKKKPRNKTNLDVIK